MNVDVQPIEDLNLKDFAPLTGIPDETVELTVGGVNGRERAVKVPRRQVYKMAQLGALNGEIADFFGFTKKTLTNHFSYELTAGRATIKVRLRQAMLKQALGPKPNIAALIFLAKNYLSMSDNGLTEKDDEEGAGVNWLIEEAKFTQPLQLSDSERAELDGENEDA
jgi:hypothetical protein